MDKPWFKFTANNWLSGSVQLLSDGEKGTYIDLMAMIWKEGGSLKVDNILSRKLRLDHATVCDRIDSYCELNILVCEDDILSIKFLSDQLEAINEVSKKNSENAKKRWSKETPSMRPNANKKRKEEKREEENVKSKPKKVFQKPTLQEAEDHKKAKDLFSIDCQYFINHYEGNGWMIGKNKMKSWTATMSNWHSRHLKDNPTTNKKDINPF